MSVSQSSILVAIRVVKFSFPLNPQTQRGQAKMIANSVTCDEQLSEITRACGADVKRSRIFVVSLRGINQGF